MARHGGGGRSEGGRKSSQGGRGSSEKASPAAIQNYLEGVDYPASKQDLVEAARSNGAPNDVIQLIQRLPDKQYGSPVDVSREIPHVEAGTR